MKQNTSSTFTGIERLEHRRLMAKNLVLDAAGLLPTDAVQVGNTSYFFANDGTYGRELWKSDGTNAGTRLVADVTGGAKGTEAFNLTQAGDKVIFFTRDTRPKRQGVPSYTYTLWSSDGTAGGTSAVATFKNIIMLNTAEVDGHAVLATYTRDAAGTEYANLWSTDGSTPVVLKSFTGDGDSTNVLLNQLTVIGDHVLARVGSDSLYSTDGTVSGTIDLTPSLAAAGGNTQDLGYDWLQVNGNTALIFDFQGAGVWTTDGTAAGTDYSALALPGRLDNITPPVVLNGVAYVVTAHSQGDDIIKDVYGVKLSDGQLTRVYTVEGDASGHRITLDAAAGGLGITDLDAGAQTSRFLISDGTLAGTKTLESNRSSAVLSSVTLDGVLYTVRINKSGTGEGGILGSHHEDGGMMIAGASAESSVELWRSDGTAAGTGRIRVLQASNPKDSIGFYELSAVDGKLVLHSETGTYKMKTGGQGQTGNDILKGVTSDTTTAYDPSELTLGRQAATARLVNGVLRLGGSLGDDNILVYRRESDPEQLVVEYNGNTRVFATADVTRIVADLQSGADRFELREGSAGFLRTRTSVNGGDGNDTILTASGYDTISGGTGNDRIYAGRGNDKVSGGDGNDRINGQAGQDQINAGTGRDRVSGGGGSDVFFGLNAIEAAFGKNYDGQSFEDDVLLS